MVGVTEQRLVPREQGTQGQVRLPVEVGQTVLAPDISYLDTRCEVVWPTTPLLKRGGISMDRLEPREELESLLARLLPSPRLEPLGRRARFPDSSASTAITCLGSVLLPELASSPLPSPPDPLSTEPPNLLKGLKGSEAAILRVTGLRPALRPNLAEFALVRRGGDSLVRRTLGGGPALL